MRYVRIFLVILAVCVMGLGALFVAATQLDTEERGAPARNPGYLETTLTAPHRTGAEAELAVFIWYPAADPAAPPTLHAQNGLFYGFHAITDAAPATGPLPLVVLSHGSGGNGPQLGWLAHALALQGFIVAAVNHPGTTSGDSDPHRTPHVWERTRDMRALIDHLLMSPPAGLAPDPKKIVAAGFSLGGHTAMALSGARLSKAAFIDYCAAYSDKVDCGWMNAAGVDLAAIDAARYEADLSDPRVTATVAIDPALPRAMTAESLSTMSAPLLLVTLGTLEEVPAAMNVTPLLAHLPEAELHETKGSWHFSFLAECSPLGRIIIGAVEDENICDDPIVRSRGKVHAELREVIGTFLAETTR